MHAQLHLGDLAEHPKVAVHIISMSAGAHAGLLGAFVIADVDGHTWLYLETAEEAQISDNASLITDVTFRFDKLRSEALPWAASRNLIMKMAEDRWI